MTRNTISSSDNLSLKLTQRINETVNACFNEGRGEMMERVTPLTAELLKYWFCAPFTAERNYNFHTGQRQAILNIIYLHEVKKVQNVLQLYEQCAPDLLPQVNLAVLTDEKYNLPKYAVKMATGTGKTWVMHALLLWQMLNARHEDIGAATPSSPSEVTSSRFMRHFLIVAPGLIVYDRLLDAFKGRLKSGETSERDAETNDFHRYQELFIPPQYREEVFSFIQNNTVSKEDGIGRKQTGDGLIALTNWHLFLTDRDEQEDTTPSSPSDKDNEKVDILAPHEVVDELLPLRPGTTAGNALDTLDRQYLRGSEMEYLAALPELMVINDEAHHIHEKNGRDADDEVKWQKGLNSILGTKADHAMQVDFSATPYVDKGTAKKPRRIYFPHIVTNFDLAAAIRQGLVKTLLLDKRQALTELETLDYKAKRDPQTGKVVGLSEGQRLMLRAGLTKLRLLEESFTHLDETKHPKMLVMCEDTNVTPYVEDFLREEGLTANDVLTIDSDRKGEMKPTEWLRVKERLFNIDRYATPRVIVSVLMLREGFDVNNICIIVPLRSTQASILLEQTIGRGLRLMWREAEYTDEKRENRQRVMIEHKQPSSYIDMLSIIEHPAFEQFYKDLMQGGLVHIDEGDLTDTGGSATGDLISVGLRDAFEKYDFTWPLILHNAEEELKPCDILPQSLAPFTAFTVDKLRKIFSKSGENFISQELLTETQFGKYSVTTDLFTAQSYGEYLQKLLRTVTLRFDRVGQRSVKRMPTLQISQAAIVGLIDRYIRTRLFGESFNPFENNDWKILLAANGIVTQHIVKELSIAIHRMQESVMTGRAAVRQLPFSQVSTLRMREKYSVEVSKCIYTRQGWPSSGGGLEERFIHFLERDAEVTQWLKINETQHAFATIYYIREDGLLASYHPDFLTATATHVYLIETKSDRDVNDQNVRRKQLATLEWCKKINALPTEERMNRKWQYVLLTETDFALTANGATLTDLVELYPVTMSALRGDLFE